MTELFAAVPQSVIIALARLVVCLLLAAIQWYVLRAILRMIRSMAFEARKEQLIVYSTYVFLGLINVPLVVFMVEGLIQPRGLFLYTPPSGYEMVVRPLAYAFFIWTLGSILFMLTAPLAMAAFAAAQFFRRRHANQNVDTTVQPFDFSRRRFLQMALAGLAAMPFAVSAYGAVAARFRKAVERVVIPVSGLPPQLDGVTIAQLSDVHSGLFMSESQMNGYVEITNELKPDLIALTGDFVSTNNSQVPPFIRAFSKLKAKYGVFACLGNHDMFTDSEEGLTAGFESAGIKLLRNENEIIEIEGAQLNIIGVDYIGLNRQYVRKLDDALRDISLEGTSILLCHSPKPFPDAAGAGIHLTLSGHTHGGQIALKISDFILTPIRFDTAFIAGLFKIDNSYLYVNRGLGTTGPPIRINAPPEITYITLKSA